MTDPNPEHTNEAPQDATQGPGTTDAAEATGTPSETASIEPTEEKVAVPASENASPEERLAALEAVLAVTKEKADQAEDARLRTLAEMENQRRRLARDREEIRRTAAAKIIEELLPAVDNLKMGLQMADNHPEAANVTKGFEFVVQQIESILAQNNLEKLEPKAGDDFDPNREEAVGQEASTEIAEGKIVRCQRVGYELNGRLLRAAMVVVSTGPES